MRDPYFRRCHHIAPVTTAILQPDLVSRCFFTPVSQQKCIPDKYPYRSGDSQRISIRRQRRNIEIVRSAQSLILNGKWQGIRIEKFQECSMQSGKGLIEAFPEADLSTLKKSKPIRVPHSAGNIDTQDGEP